MTNAKPRLQPWTTPTVRPVPEGETKLALVGGAIIRYTDGSVALLIPMPDMDPLA